MFFYDKIITSLTCHILLSPNVLSLLLSVHVLCIFPRLSVCVCVCVCVACRAWSREKNANLAFCVLRLEAHTDGRVLLASTALRLCLARTHISPFDAALFFLSIALWCMCVLRAGHAWSRRKRQARTRFFVFVPFFGHRKLS